MAKWIDKIREKEGKKGLLPWLSVKIQKWILIGLACVGLLGTVIGVLSGGYFPVGLVSTIVGAAALYVGFKTAWLKNLDKASRPVRITGTILISAGTLMTIVFLAYAVIWIVFFIVIILILGAIFYFVVLGGADKGKIEGRAGEVIGETRIIRKKFLGQGSNLFDESGIKIGEIQKAWFSNDQIIRDDAGTKIGNIKQNVWNKDVQDIYDESEKKVGEIKTDLAGDREIVDGSGSRVGVIGKNLWGETTIREE